MVDELKVSAIDINKLPVNNVVGDYKIANPEEISIFSSSDLGSKEENIAMLNQYLEESLADDGLFQKGWDGLKNLLNSGANSEKCNEMIQKYAEGSVTFEQAVAEIEKFENKQDSSLNLFSNIATSFAAIAAATAAVAAVVGTGGAAAPAVLAAIAKVGGTTAVAAVTGAGAGAVTKSTFKMADRATNEVEKDALNGKQIARDALSGAVTGAIAGATMGNGKDLGSVSKSMFTCSKNSAVLGVKTGAISGSSNYVIDCAFDEDKTFNVKDLVTTTATTAAVGAGVGAIMGGMNGALKSTGVLKHGGKVQLDETGNKVLGTSINDQFANSMCSTEYKILTAAINDKRTAA